MDHDFWLQKWQAQDTKWNQSEVNANLLNLHSILGDLSNKTVFIPLCGKSVDMLWFYQQGANVIGAELSQDAIEQFYDENHLSYTIDQTDTLKVYRDQRISIVCGDLFQIKPEATGQIDIIYDRAALIALPKEMRAKYVNKLTELLPKGGQIFLIGADYKAPEINLPPFPVTKEEIHQLYDPHFKVELLLQTDNPGLAKHLEERGFHDVSEYVFLLTKS